MHATRSNNSYLLYSFAALVLIGTIHFFLGNEVAMSVFYLLPILAVGKTHGKYHAFAFAFLSALAWFFVDIKTLGGASNPFLSAWNALTRMIFFSIFVLLVDVQSTLARERYYFKRDFLTGLANRHAFYEYSHKVLLEKKRHEGLISLAYIDCDNFKIVNDEYGHDVGDKVLKVIAEILRKVALSSDMAARIGGDEFVVLLTENNPRRVRKIAQDLYDFLNAAMRSYGWPITFSIGVVSYSKAPDTVEEMVKSSDQLMYKSKKYNKNNIRFSQI